MQYKRLWELATVKFCSVTPSRTKQQSASSKWLACANFMADNEVILSPTVNNLVPDEEWRLHKNDIVIKRITPSFINFIDFDPDELFCGNNLIIVTPFDEMDGKYLAMVLNESISDLSKESSVGAVMKSISRGDLEAMEIPLPEQSRRKVIGELWYKGIQLKKKRLRLAELENIRTNYIIKKSIYSSGGKHHGKNDL